MLAFLEKDLDSLLCHEWKHDKGAQWIAPAQIHPIPRQQWNEKNHGEVRSADAKHCSRLEWPAAPFDSEDPHVRTDDRYDQQRNSGTDSPGWAPPGPQSRPRQRCS